MIDKMESLLFILIFGIVLLAIIGVYHYISYLRERRDLVIKIKHEGSKPKTPGQKILPGIDAVTSWAKQNMAKAMSWLGHFMKQSEGELSSMQKKLLRGGYRSRNAAIIFFGTKGFSAILLSATFFSLKILLSWQITPDRFMFILILLALIGFYLPNIWLKAHINQRKVKISEGFPDMLDLLVVCVEAGMGLDSAINRVTDEMKLINREIYDELQVLNRELRGGKQRLEALKGLAFRTDLEDVKSLVTLLIQSDRFGTSVAQALRIHSDSMRVKRFQKAEEIAAQIAVKLLFPLIFCIFPSLFIIILGPAVIQVMKIFHP